jgi:hypothetical protein
VPPEHEAAAISTSKEPEKPGANIKGLDIGALLDEIRSIGLKI